MIVLNTNQKEFLKCIRKYTYYSDKEFEITQGDFDVDVPKRTADATMSWSERAKAAIKNLTIKEGNQVLDYMMERGENHGIDCMEWDDDIKYYAKDSNN